MRRGVLVLSLPMRRRVLHLLLLGLVLTLRRWELLLLLDLWRPGVLTLLLWGRGRVLVVLLLEGRVLLGICHRPRAGSPGTRWDGNGGLPGGVHCLSRIYRDPSSPQDTTTPEHHSHHPPHVTTQPTSMHIMRVDGPGCGVAAAAGMGSSVMLPSSMC